jgi:hypothetical protein
MDTQIIILSMNVLPVLSTVIIVQVLEPANAPNVIHLIFSTKTNVYPLVLMDTQIIILSMNVLPVLSTVIIVQDLEPANAPNVIHLIFSIKTNV